ncbi:MAG: pyruvate kinase [Candidatus Moranbacteria bacterium]|nr:pyruvate kinase [Candidatus Moranbacteria bacterium]
MQTKIVCTIGPASKEKKTLKKMIKAGMTVGRINFSHGTHESNGKILKNIRRASQDLNKDVAVMTDLQGPRIRIASVKKELIIKKNQKIFLYENKKPDIEFKEKVKFLGIDSKNLLKYLKKGDSVYIDNGMMELNVVDKKAQGIVCDVVVGGKILPRKGINIPQISPKMEAFTKSDKKNLEYALSQNVDLIAMSFVKTQKDILNLRKTIKKMLPGVKEEQQPGIIAKIETSAAVKNFDQILQAVDGVMIARGDLAIEEPMEKIPALQKEMIKKCLNYSKPVIVATQMLESMMENPRPTRAEITDVANAVIDHADAVMLSGESAMGKYPVETVSTMQKIIQYTEEGPFDDLKLEETHSQKEASDLFVAKSAVMLAGEIEAKSIIIKNSPKEIVQKISSFRPQTKIYYLTKNSHIAKKLALVWGVSAIDDIEKLKGPYVVIDNIGKGNGQIKYKI